MKRAIRPVLLTAAALATGYLILVASPELLFRYQRQRGAIILHSDAPISALADPILDRAAVLLARSPLFDPTRTYDVFLCQSKYRFALFARTKWRAGGIVGIVGRNVFLRPAHVERDRLVGPSGREVDGERTLSYFVAHEVAHVVTLDALGRVRYALLPEWVREGYADHIAKDLFDVSAAMTDWRTHARRMDPASGLYDRYQLQVTRALVGRSDLELLQHPSGFSAALDPENLLHDDAR